MFQDRKKGYLRGRWLVVLTTWWNSAATTSHPVALDGFNYEAGGFLSRIRPKSAVRLPI
jgi:hypothetical protein